MIDVHWLASLRAANSLPPRQPRLPLWVDSEGQLSQVGSVEAGLLEPLVADGHDRLRLRDHDGQAGWHVGGNATDALNELARQLASRGWTGAWRDEQLTVCDSQQRSVATIERAAVRPLGIATRAVHLVGMTAEGRVWIQQRALDKANDPGLWDTLMGGMVSAGDDLHQALVRETWEEAGLRPPDWHSLRHGGCLPFCKPSPDCQGRGYLVEHIDWFQAVLGAGVVPNNQDGEVAQFRCVDRATLIDMLHHDAFTPEAALILVDALTLTPCT